MGRGWVGPRWGGVGWLTTQSGQLFYVSLHSSSTPAPPPIPTPPHPPPAQATLAPPAPLTIRGVLASLRGMAAERGRGAAARRKQAVLGLLRAARESETRYLVRTLVQVGLGWG